MKKPKKAREEAKGAPAGTKEARKRYILAKFLHCGEKLAFLALWGLVRADSGSPFKGLSDSTFRRDLYALAKEGAVEIIRGKSGHIIIGFPPESTASKPGRKRKAGGKKPAGDVTGAAPAGSADAVLDEMASDAAERGMREIEEELNKPRERLKTQAEIDAELAPMRERAAALHRELGALERKIQDVECVWADRHLILTTAPLPEAPETLIVN